MKAQIHVRGIILMVACAALVGCVPPEFNAAGKPTTSRFDDVVLDTEGVDNIKLRSDVDSCRKIRDSSDQSDALSELVGVALVAAIGDPIDDKAGAAAGAGSVNEAPNKGSIFRNCLSGRGHKVLN